MSKSKILFCTICFLAFIVMLKDRVELPLLFILGSIAFLCLAGLYLRDHPQASYRLNLSLAGTGLVLLMAATLFVLIPSLTGSSDANRPTLPTTSGQVTQGGSPEDTKVTFIRNCLNPD